MPSPDWRDQVIYFVMTDRFADGDPANNRPSNLRYDTPSENGYDTVRHGHHRGASATHCKRGHEFATYAVYEPNYNRRYCGRCRKLRERPH